MLLINMIQAENRNFYDVSDEDIEVESAAADYPVTMFITEGGYAKKIRTANLRMSGEQKG